MKDWKLVAEGLGLGLSAADIERITPALDALESAFRPLAGNIPHETEPALAFEAPVEEQP
jgi:hypothetical protein